MMKDINPTTFSLTAVIVGILASSDLSYPECNALGNWFVLLGDYLLTYASQVYVIESKKDRDNDYLDKIHTKDDLDYLYMAINKMKEELDNIKKETH